MRKKVSCQWLSQSLHSIRTRTANCEEKATNLVWVRFLYQEQFNLFFFSLLCYNHLVFPKQKDLCESFYILYKCGINEAGNNSCNIGHDKNTSSSEVKVYTYSGRVWVQIPLCGCHFFSTLTNGLDLHHILLHVKLNDLPTTVTETRYIRDDLGRGCQCIHSRTT